MKDIFEFLAVVGVISLLLLLVASSLPEQEPPFRAAPPSCLGKPENCFIKKFHVEYDKSAFCAIWEEGGEAYVECDILPESN